MQGSAESGYVLSWGSSATIPMLGKGVRYSTVYQEKGRNVHIREDLKWPGAVLLNTERVFMKKPFPLKVPCSSIERKRCALNGTEISLEKRGPCSLCACLYTFKWPRWRQWFSKNWHRMSLQPWQQNTIQNTMFSDPHCYILTLNFPSHWNRLIC